MSGVTVQELLMISEFSVGMRNTISGMLDAVVVKRSAMSFSDIADLGFGFGTNQPYLFLHQLWNIFSGKIP